jgi:peptide/nickel transport system ATP-binding protein
VFGNTRRHVMAVNDVSFHIQKGETFGLVGESGCGKTTLARALLRLVPPMGGKIWFEGRDVLALSPGNCASCGGTCKLCFKIPSVL